MSYQLRAPPLVAAYHGALCVLLLQHTFKHTVYTFL